MVNNAVILDGYFNWTRPTSGVRGDRDNLTGVFLASSRAIRRCCAGPRPISTGLGAGRTGTGGGAAYVSSTRRDRAHAPEAVTYSSRGITITRCPAILTGSGRTPADLGAGSRNDSPHRGGRRGGRAILSRGPRGNGGGDRPAVATWPDEAANHGNSMVATEAGDPSDHEIRCSRGADRAGTSASTGRDRAAVVSERALIAAFHFQAVAHSGAGLLLLWTASTLPEGGRGAQARAALPGSRPDGRLSSARLQHLPCGIRSAGARIRDGRLAQCRVIWA